MNLSSSDYDCYEIIYKLDKSSSQTFSTGKTIKGSGTYLQVATGASSGAITRFRNITYSSNTKLVAGNGRQAIGTSAVADNNEMCIPIYIIGYKTGLFN